MSESTKKTERKRPKTTIGAKKERASGKKVAFNLLDVILILALILSAGLVISVYAPGGLFFMPDRQVTLVYTVEISGVPAEYASAINVGDSVYDSDGSALGEIAADVEVEPYVVYEYKDSDNGIGSLVSIEHTDLKCLVLTISVKADYKEGVGYTADGRRIAVGAKYDLVLPGFESSGECIGITAENSANGGE